MLSGGELKENRRGRMLRVIRTDQWCSAFFPCRSDGLCQVHPWASPLCCDLANGAGVVGAWSSCLAKVWPRFSHAGLAEGGGGAVLIATTPTLPDFLTCGKFIVLDLAHGLGVEHFWNRFRTPHFSWVQQQWNEIISPNFLPVLDD